MTCSEPIANNQYRLRSIAGAGRSRYVLKFEANSGAIEASCEIISADGVELLLFEPEEFRHLCTRGLVDMKALRSAVIAFRESNC